MKAVARRSPVGVTSRSPTSSRAAREPVRGGSGHAYGEWLERSGVRATSRGADLSDGPHSGYRRATPPLPHLPFTEPGDSTADLQRPEAFGTPSSTCTRMTGKPVLVPRMGSRPRTTSDGSGTSTPRSPGCMRPSNVASPCWATSLVSLDNFEWIRGYARRNGTDVVDRTTVRSDPEPSSRASGRIARRTRCRPRPGRPIKV